MCFKVEMTGVESLERQINERSLPPPPVAVPAGAAGSTGEGLAEELGSGQHGRPASAPLSGRQPRGEEGTSLRLPRHVLLLLLLLAS